MPPGFDIGATFDRHHPQWEHRLWTDAELTAGDWRTGDLLRRAEEFAPDDAIRFRVDVWRLEILARHGGIYVDCDAVCLRPMDRLLDYDGFVAQSPNDQTKATNAVMGVAPGHPFTLALLDGLAERAERYRGRRVFESVGGDYLTEMLGEYDVEMLPWWLFAGRSIKDRNAGRRRDPRHEREGMVDHLYGNTLQGLRGWVPDWARRAKARLSK